MEKSQAVADPQAPEAGARYVFPFSRGRPKGPGLTKELLGGKGDGLAEMAALGLPVPPGFTVSTEACRGYYASGKKFPPGLWDEIRSGLRGVERETGRVFGSEERPLLVSVRSGARVSMPGMMDTILNLGLTPGGAKALARGSGGERFAADTYDRFRAMFEKTVGRKPPENPWDQLELAVRAVFDSWFGARAIAYREIYSIPDDWGTAANVQAMVFGNLGASSGSGVAFTRDPNTGENKIFGEFLFDAQGEDVVAGIRTPLPAAALEQRLPEAFLELKRISGILENRYRDMLDIEFTVEEGRLYMLQVRVGKRSAPAAVRMALEMAQEGLIGRKAAVARVRPEQLEQLLHPMVDPSQKVTVLAKGLPASRGAASGKVVLTAQEAEAAGKRGEKVILVRRETSPEDIVGMHAAQGILTARGGMTSHAAVVARGMGKCAVVGCEGLEIGTTVKAGDVITLNGSTGEVLAGEARLIRPEAGRELIELLKWADEIRRLGVRANADTVEDARAARAQGAEGIGLCRTEHMFFAPDRILAVREMILAEDAAGRRRALDKILPMQRLDFEGIFREMAGFPVAIRLLDPPLHEFLPHSEREFALLAQEMGSAVDRLIARNRALQEFNPMLGHRGCRLGISFPEIYEMQARAVFEAACAAAKAGVDVRAEVMIPLVAEPEELARLRSLCVQTADKVMAEAGTRLKYKIGTMIELPRAALLADKIAANAEFFSFGTNDLTQTTYGLSRDDAGKFLPTYVQQGILPKDPFVSLDQEGVGQLVRWAVERGRAARPTLEAGICGEHGGDPESIAFCHRIGLDYVSCSPYRVAVARLAAAHAALEGAVDASV